VTPKKPRFFATPDAFRAWLEKNHEGADELWVGFYKRGSERPSITWPESVDQALCFGWIDGLRRSIDETAYMIRFTPRKTTSTWSAINVRRVGELAKLGLMTEAGQTAFEARRADKTSIYSFERTTPGALEPAEEKELRANPRASEFFDAQAPWYRRTATHWVVSAKRPETRARRLETLIACSAADEKIPQLRPSGPPKPRPR
jgi:uncharacterized protein YdeI (YjbR/CyaY-like superfamily)